MLLLLTIFLAAGPARGERGFEFLSRSLMQGPCRTAVFFEKGLVLGTGGGIVVTSPATDIANHTYIPIEGEPKQIVTEGGAAYIAAHMGGLITVDLSDPGNPSVTHRHKVHRATSCCISGNFLYLSDFKKRIHVFDLKNPLEPELLSVQTLRFPLMMLVSEGDMLAAVHGDRFMTYHINSDGTLKKLAETETGANTRRGYLAGGILYLITTDGDVLRWSLADAAAPLSLDPLPTDKAIEMKFTERRGFVLTINEEIVPFDIPAGCGSGNSTGGASQSNITMDKPLKAVSKPKGARSSLSQMLGKLKGSTNFNASTMAVTDSYIAAIEPRKGLSLYELDKDTAWLEGTLQTGGFAIDLVASDGYLYVANSRDGVRIGRVSNEGTVEWIGHVQTSVARDLALNGSNLILADGDSGIKVIDVSDPRNPVVIGGMDSPFFQSAIVTQGDYAYTAGGLGGAEVYDISNPRSPKLVWREEFSEVRGVHVDRDHLYLADGYDGFRIYSIADKKPAFVSIYDTPGWNDDVFVVGDRAYLSDGGKGIRIIDIADRSNPRDIGAAELGTLVRNVHARGDMLFAACHTKGIKAIDISDASEPFETAKYQTVDDGRGVYVDDRFVYLASGSGGVYIFRYHDE